MLTNNVMILCAIMKKMGFEPSNRLEIRESMNASHNTHTQRAERSSLGLVHSQKALDAKKSQERVYLPIRFPKEKSHLNALNPVLELLQEHLPTLYPAKKTIDLHPEYDDSGRHVKTAYLDIQPLLDNPALLGAAINRIFDQHHRRKFLKTLWGFGTTAAMTAYLAVDNLVQEYVAIEARRWGENHPGAAFNPKKHIPVLIAGIGGAAIGAHGFASNKNHEIKSLASDMYDDMFSQILALRERQEGRTASR